MPYQHEMGDNRSQVPLDQCVERGEAASLYIHELHDRMGECGAVGWGTGRRERWGSKPDLLYVYLPPPTWMALPELLEEGRG